MLEKGLVTPGGLPIRLLCFDCYRFGPLLVWTVIGFEPLHRLLKEDQ